MSKFKTISFYAKCSDLCGGNIVNDSQNTFEFDGYPPKFLGDGNGINLEIDLETGHILNWKKPSDDDIVEFLDIDQEEFDK
jgi:hypothetical protein